MMPAAKVVRVSPPRRIVVRAPNWLGDVVMSTPGLGALRGAYPDAHIVLVMPAHLAPLLSGSSDFDEIWTLEAKGLASLRSMAKRIRAASFDLGVVIPESISSAAMLRWGRVGNVVGFSRDPLRTALLHRRLTAPAEWGSRRLVSKEDFVLRLMEAVGAESQGTRLRLEVTDDDVEGLSSAVSGCGLDPASFLTASPIVIAPGASYGDSKCWPVERYAEFADAMAARGESVVLIGTAAEIERTRAVRRKMSSAPIDLTGRLSLGALKSLLAGARLLVSNDAGARHVAAAFDLPSVIFFGPTSVEKTASNLSCVEVLETEHDCRPCYRRSCPIDHRCLVSISVAEAIAAADRALATRPVAASSAVDSFSSVGARAGVRSA